MTTSRQVIPASKPRNPCVPAARFRQAGAHQRTAGGERRMDKQRLRRELAALPAGSRGRPPSP
jgi:hypothetical protein